MGITGVNSWFGHMTSKVTISEMRIVWHDAGCRPCHREER